MFTNLLPIAGWLVTLLGVVVLLTGLFVRWERVLGRMVGGMALAMEGAIILLVGVTLAEPVSRTIDERLSLIERTVISIDTRLASAGH